MSRSPSPSVHLARTGHALLAVPFVLGASHALRHPGPLLDVAERAGLPRPELLTRATAGVMLAGAVAVGASLAPAAGGVLLAGSLIGTTLVVHSFWRVEDAQARAAHKRAFVANCGLLGGVLVVTAHAFAHRRAEP